MPLITDDLGVSVTKPTAHELPSGWGYVDREGIDSVMGHYRDAQSGLSVTSEEGLSVNEPHPWSGQTSTSDGYQTWRGRLAEMPYEQAIRVVSSECDDVIITLAPETIQGRSLNLRGKVCGDNQRARLRDLVAYLADPERWPSQRL